MLEEIEVYRVTPEKGKFYETTRCTRIEGEWFTAKYYTTNPFNYVGEFIEHYQLGWGGSSAHGGKFIKNGKIERIPYRHDRTTCFREVLPRGLPKNVKEELLKKQENLTKNPASLESLAKNALSTLDIENARIFL